MKKIISYICCSLFMVLLANLYIVKQYQEYIIDTNSNIIENILEKYPDTEEIIIDSLLDENKNHKFLKTYGINENTLKEFKNYREVRNKTIFINLSLFLMFLLGFFIIFGISKRKIKKEINTINSYLNQILSGTYGLNFQDYQEDEISVLKNDIYKVAIKLKDLSLYERREQVYLMNTLEDISHQLKTPLTALMVINDILKNNELTYEERTDFLNKQSRELEKMEWLITTLLKYSKLDSGSILLKEERIKASCLIEESLESLLIPMELKNIYLEYKHLDFDVICDIKWTKEALMNILKNAYEHVNYGGVITIEGECNPIYNSISIKDNGLGISKKEIKNIFKRFYTTDSSKNSFGIGLNMAKLIIEKENGKIEVTSKEGEYTEFKIIFMHKKDTI